MDNIKKQLRFFKILTVLLSVFVLAQFSFWLHQFTKPACTQNTTIEKVNYLDRPSVLSPAVSAVFQFISNLASGNN